MSPDEEQSAFYENLGRCIAQWSHVEDGLYEVYATAIAKAGEARSSNVALQAAYYAIQAPEGKITMTDLLSGLGCFPEWGTIMTIHSGDCSQRGTRSRARSMTGASAEINSRTSKC